MLPKCRAIPAQPTSFAKDETHLAAVWAAVAGTPGTGGRDYLLQWSGRVPVAAESSCRGRGHSRLATWSGSLSCEGAAGRKQSIRRTCSGAAGLARTYSFKTTGTPLSKGKKDECKDKAYLEHEFILGSEEGHGTKDQLEQLQVQVGFLGVSCSTGRRVTRDILNRT